MKRIGLLMLVLALLFAFGFVAAYAAEWTGVITETHCGAAHKGGTDKDIQCIKECVTSGRGKLALLVGDDVLTITNSDKATGHEGHKVTVVGTADNAAKTVTIESLTMAS